MRRPARRSSRRRADRRQASRPRALLRGDRESRRHAAGRLVDADGWRSMADHRIAQAEQAGALEFALRLYHLETTSALPTASADSPGSAF
jgi:hypothetical protein